MLRFETTQGNFTVELFEKEAPITTKNFLEYVDANHYDGTIFHRVIPGFMIQGGGMEPGMKEKKTRPAIKNEASNGLSNKRGTLAMARTVQADSATAQFYINVVDNKALDDGKYCVFGKVIEGLDVVDKVKAVKTGNKGGHQNVPLKLNAALLLYCTLFASLLFISERSEWISTYSQPGESWKTRALNSVSGLPPTMHDLKPHRLAPSGSSTGGMF